MSREKYDPSFEDDEHEEANPEKEKRQHMSTLKRYKHLDVEVRRQEMEALEEAMTSLGAKKAKKAKQGIAKDFLEKHRGDQKPDSDLISFLRGHSGGSHGGVNSKEYEPGTPTGIAEFQKEMPWDEDED